MVNDPIADLLTRIKNATVRSHKEVVIPSSKMIEAIVAILKAEGYVEDFAKIESDAVQPELKITLRYNGSQPAITHVERISTPGLRKYVGYKEIPRVLNGLGVAIVSTSKGVMTGKQAVQDRVGGEYLCTIW